MWSNFVCPLGPFLLAQSHIIMIYILLILSLSYRHLQTTVALYNSAAAKGSNVTTPIKFVIVI